MIGCVTVNEFLKRQYEIALQEIGPRIVPLVKARMKRARGEMRDRLVILLAHLGVKGLGREIERILKESPNGFVRQLAARILGDIGYRKALPSLLRALHDPFWVFPATCVILPGIDPANYPVRASAAGSLMRMGFEVKRIGDNRWHVRGPPQPHSFFRPKKALLQVDGKPQRVHILTNGEGDVLVPLSWAISTFGIKVQTEGGRLLLMGKGHPTWGNQAWIEGKRGAMLVGGKAWEWSAPHFGALRGPFVPLKVVAWISGARAIWDGKTLSGLVWGLKR